MSNDLSILSQHRQALLLAELGAWLHNIGKLSKEFLLFQQFKKQLPHDNYNYQSVASIFAEWWQTNSSGLTPEQRKAFEIDAIKATHSLTTSVLHTDAKKWLQQSNIALPAPFDERNYTIGDFIEFQAGKWYETKNYGRKIDLVFPVGSKATKLIQASHHAASGVEKDESEGDGFTAYIATAFGQEQKIKIDKLTDLRNDLLARLPIAPRMEALSLFQSALPASVADTRHPINEVTLLDISSAVAAFFKAALAKCVLEKYYPTAFQWRILRVATNGPDFYSNVARLPDLLIRRKLLNAALDGVQRLLEEDFPLGNEVYRDEFGSAFIVPYLEGDDDKGTKLKSLVQAQIVGEFESSAIGGEIIPYLTVSQPHPQGLTLGAEISREPQPVCADQERLKLWWQATPKDRCSVCGVRPQGATDKSLQRKVCDTCEQRREERSIEWATKLETTIWTDEIADVNGRLCLIAGQFEIADWLKPEGLIKTLRIRKVTDPNEVASKNPSFARLRRVWETTEKFWDDIAAGFQTSVGTVSPRLRIQGQFNSASGEKLRRSHTYEIQLAGTRLSIVCVREGEFLTAENLRRVARLLNAPQEFQTTDCAAATWVQDRLQHQSFKLEEPTGYGVANRLSGTFTVINVTPEPTPYIPALTILSEPRSFMALVPADKALAVAQAIKAKYETEMGKVRNRLPLTLGLVFANARTPLAAVLDAGRRMLKRKLEEQEFAIKDAQTVGKDRVLQFNNGVEWKVPLMMGDGVTEDQWYPYYFVDAVTRQHQRYFQHPDNQRWLVHAEDLQANDKVKVYPSYFDFEFLDTAARRFEISYSNDNGGKRRGAQHPARPYFLERLDDLQTLWQTISAGLDTSQIKQIEGVLTLKREEWGAGEVFQQFVRDTVHRAHWKDGKRPDNDTMQTIAQAAIDGVLSDIVELFMELKSEVTQ